MLTMRILQADLISAWGDARRQVAREADIRAERRAQGSNEPPRLAEVRSMKSAFVAVHGELRDAVVPGRFLFGSKLEQLIENEPEAEKMEEVPSREGGEDDLMVPEITPGGQLKVRTGAAKKTNPPRDVRSSASSIALSFTFGYLRAPGTRIATGCCRQRLIRSTCLPSKFWERQ